MRPKFWSKLSKSFKAKAKVNVIEKQQWRKIKGLLCEILLDVVKFH
jgi:hypothetical protein